MYLCPSCGEMNQVALTIALISFHESFFFFYLSEEGECYETTLTFNVKTSLMLPCALLDVSFLPLCFHSLNKKQTTNKQNTFTNLSLSFSFFCVYVWEKTGVNMKRFCVFVLFL